MFHKNKSLHDIQTFLILDKTKYQKKTNKISNKFSWSDGYQIKI